MPLVLDTRFRALDVSGDAYSGALLYVYLPGTNTLADIYATSALDGGASLSNPVVSDSSGYFAQIFAPEGDTFDVTLKTAAGATIKTYEDVPALGADPGTFARDYGTGGRFSVTGSAGTITFAAGPASPDDTGGDLELTGYAGTQLDTLRLYSNDVTVPPSTLHDESGSDLTLAGEILQDGGKRSPEIIWGESTFSGASSLDLAIPADYDVFEVELTELVVSAGGAINARLAYDATPTYKSASGDYVWTYTEAAAGTVTGSYDTGAGTYVKLAAITTGSNYKGSILARIITSSTANVATQIAGTGHTLATGVTTTTFTGFGLHSYGRATYIRFLPLSGTITGRYRTKAIRGLGGTSA